MDEPLAIDRRQILGLLAGSLFAVLAAPVCAKDGGDGHDDGGHGDDGHGDDHGGRSGKRNDDYSQDEALDDVRRGRIITLREALRTVNRRTKGKVIEVRLVRPLSPQYRFTLRLKTGGIIRMWIDARTGRLINQQDY